jgi:hypothetical protein
MCSQNISSQLQVNLRGARSEEEATTDRHDRATEQGSLGTITKSPSAIHLDALSDDLKFK